MKYGQKGRIQRTRNKDGTSFLHHTHGLGHQWLAHDAEEPGEHEVHVAAEDKAQDGADDEAAPRRACEGGTVVIYFQRNTLRFQKLSNLRRKGQKPHIFKSGFELPPINRAVPSYRTVPK